MKQLIGLINIALLSLSLSTFAAGGGRYGLPEETKTPAQTTAIKSDFELLQGLWKDTNSRSRNIRITLDHDKISIDCRDTQDNEITQVSDILWQDHTLKMVMYTPSTGYRNTIVLKLTAQNELRGTASGSWNGEILWTRLPSNSK